MKVIEDVQDKHGNYCIIFKSTNLRLIYDWLHTLQRKRLQVCNRN